jgi:putative hemolysin
MNHFINERSQPIPRIQKIARASRIAPTRRVTMTWVLILAVALLHLAVNRDAIAFALPNPASVYCVQQGGRIEIIREPQGERGLCVLPDGRRIDEWEFYRQSLSPAPTSPN